MPVKVKPGLLGACVFVPKPAEPKLKPVEAACADVPNPPKEGAVVDGAAGVDAALTAPNPPGPPNVEVKGDVLASVAVGALAVAAKGVVAGAVTGAGVVVEAATTEPPDKLCAWIWPA